jgi:hypothetical protein
VDDEAEHDSDGSNGEENIDKYESDFIDDTVQEGYVDPHNFYIFCPYTLGQGTYRMGGFTTACG